MTSIFSVQCIIKQLLDSVFVIFRIIKVSLRLRLRLITLTPTLIILNVTKTSSNNCLGLTKFRVVLGSLSKPCRRRQRERHQTTIAVHVRYKSLYISLPSCARQQPEMTKFGWCTINSKSRAKNTTMIPIPYTIT